LHQEGFPFVLVGCREIDGAELSYVAANYAAATAEVVEHLAAAGHTRMLFIGNMHRLEAALHRETGFRGAHQRLGLPLDEARICRIPPDVVTGPWLQSWLDVGVTAFVAEETAHTICLLAAARQLGRRIPDDFSLAALGNPTSSNEAIPGLTTFHIPRQEMGAEAVLLLARMLEQPAAAAPFRATLTWTIVPGQTVAPPR
ncbi:MAG: substrate-binding domain-containing protein, partial [Dehalococcoidia bacterium]